MRRLSVAVKFHRSEQGLGQEAPANQALKPGVVEAKTLSAHVTVGRREHEVSKRRNPRFSGISLVQGC